MILDKYSWLFGVLIGFILGTFGQLLLEVWRERRTYISTKNRLIAEIIKNIELAKSITSEDSNNYGRFVRIHYDTFDTTGYRFLQTQGLLVRLFINDYVLYEEIQDLYEWLERENQNFIVIKTSKSGGVRPLDSYSLATIDVLCEDVVPRIQDSILPKARKAALEIDKTPFLKSVAWFKNWHRVKTE